MRKLAIISIILVVSLLFTACETPMEVYGLGSTYEQGNYDLTFENAMHNTDSVVYLFTLNIHDMDYIQSTYSTIDFVCLNNIKDDASYQVYINEIETILTTNLSENSTIRIVFNESFDAIKEDSSSNTINFRIWNVKFYDNE